jgi:hypothetical protein
VVVGTGEYAYEAVAEGADLPIIAGPQGGYHVWVGLLARNLRRGCVVETQLTLIDSDEAVGNPLFFEVQLFDAEDGWLQYAGLPVVLDPTAVEDQPLRVDLTLTDGDGAEAIGSLSIVPRLL